MELVCNGCLNPISPYKMHDCKGKAEDTDERDPDAQSWALVMQLQMQDDERLRSEEAPLKFAHSLSEQESPIESTTTQNKIIPTVQKTFGSSPDQLQLDALYAIELAHQEAKNAKKEATQEFQKESDALYVFKLAQEEARKERDTELAFSTQLILRQTQQRERDDAKIAAYFLLTNLNNSSIHGIPINHYLKIRNSKIINS
jgi:hypothetical protein